VWGIVTIVLLSCTSALLWLSYDLMASYSLFGPSVLPHLIHAAAAISTAVLAVIVIGQLALRFVFARLLRSDPNDLQRSLLFAALSFAAVAIVLADLGFNPTTILTTSAIVTAVVGLSIQPLLGSMLSGLSLGRVVRVGDGVILDGQQIEVVSLNWRSVIGRRADGGTVVLPNSQLSNNALTILSRDHSAAVEIALEVPAGVAPHRLRELVGTLVMEFPEVDPVKPVRVRPIDYQPSKPFSGYSVAIWVRHYGQRRDVADRMLQRIWYLFQRENIVAYGNGGDPAATRNRELMPAVAAALRTAGESDGDAAKFAAQPERALDAGEILSFGAGERIVFPSRLTGRAGLLLNGELREDAIERLEHPLSREAWLDRIEQALAQHIGPYAEYAVREAAAGGGSVLQVCRMVGGEIDDPQRQVSFMRTVNPPSDISHRSGFLFRLRPDGLARSTENPILRAGEHALILALPEWTRDSDIRTTTKRIK